jgi:hypothetical protein
VRAVRYCPGSAEARDESLRCASAHSEICQIWIRPDPAPPEAQYAFSAVKAEVEPLGQVAVVQAVIMIALMQAKP